jgi:hypothetical protein
MHENTKSALARAWLAIGLRLHGREPGQSRVEETSAETPQSTDLLLSALEALGHRDGNYHLLKTETARRGGIS